MQVMWSVVNWNSGLVAVGGSGDGRWVPSDLDYTSMQTAVPAVWVSDDGMSWDRIDGIAHGDAPATMRDVTVAGRRLVSVGLTGYDITRPVVWVSGDGRYWDRIPDETTPDWAGPIVEVGDPEPGRSIWMTAVDAGDDDNLAAVAIRAWTTSAWSGSPPRSWAGHKPPLSRISRIPITQSD
jgi:hypothetical protein